MDFLESGLDIETLDELVVEYKRCKELATKYRELYQAVAKKIAEHTGTNAGEKTKLATRHGDLTVTSPMSFKGDTPAVIELLKEHPELERNVIGVSYRLTLPAYEKADIETRKLLDGAFTASAGQPNIGIKDA